MATVGQVLTAPEAGWKRYDDMEPKIKYCGAWKTNPDYYAYSERTFHYSSLSTDCYCFKFKGTKMRLITERNTCESTNVNVNIDGIDYSYSENGALLNQVLSFEVTGLNNTEHVVKVTNKDAQNVITIDAIDIDEYGELISLISTPNLIAIAGDSQVALSWTAVDGCVTSYTVKRSTTAGGPYETITCNVTGNNYVDTSVTNGTTYYYVVTAVTPNGESGNSNEASATPQGTVTPPTPTTGNSLLRVTIIDSSEHDYQLSSTEIDDFVNWYMKHTSADTVAFMLNKKVGTQNSKEYLAFDKIISFEVLELS